MCIFTGGWTCSQCGIYVPYGTYHVCYPTYQLDLSFNYECPGCKGRFNTPAYDYQFNTSGSAKCPFCGKEMLGLNR